MLGKYLLPLILLVGVILFSSIIGPMISSVERFQDGPTMPSEILVCPGCNEVGTCKCHIVDQEGNVKNPEGTDYTITKDKNNVNEGMANMEDIQKSSPTGFICIECNEDKSSCKCFPYVENNRVKDTSIAYTAAKVDSDNDGEQTITKLIENLQKATTTSNTPTQKGSTPDLVEPALQGKHPIPYFELVDRVRRNEEIEETQSKHIEDIRRVLANTITSLRKDDVLPSGSHCSCANAPVIDPLTGEVDLTEGCRPPGWLRMMNTRNERDEECKA